MRALILELNGTTRLLQFSHHVLLEINSKLKPDSKSDFELHSSLFLTEKDSPQHNAEHSFVYVSPAQRFIIASFRHETFLSDTQTAVKFAPHWPWMLFFFPPPGAAAQHSTAEQQRARKKKINSNCFPLRVVLLPPKKYISTRALLKTKQKSVSRQLNATKYVEKKQVMIMRSYLTVVQPIVTRCTNRH